MLHLLTKFFGLATAWKSSGFCRQSCKGRKSWGAAAESSALWIKDNANFLSCNRVVEEGQYILYRSICTLCNFSRTWDYWISAKAEMWENGNSKWPFTLCLFKRKEIILSISKWAKGPKMFQKLLSVRKSPQRSKMSIRSVLKVKLG